MNHLAHFFLSGNDEDLAIGNFVADFITNRELPNYTEGVKRGIFLHRAIDAFTDSHLVVKQSTKRLHPFHHKYSPVIVDVYYDFLLAKNWDKFDNKANYFWLNFILLMFAFIIMMLLLKRLNKVFQEGAH